MASGFELRPVKGRHSIAMMNSVAGVKDTENRRITSCPQVEAETDKGCRGRNSAGEQRDAGFDDVPGDGDRDEDPDPPPQNVGATRRANRRGYRIWLAQRGGPGRTLLCPSLTPKEFRRRRRPRSQEPTADEDWDF